MSEFKIRAFALFLFGPLYLPLMISSNLSHLHSHKTLSYLLYSDTLSHPIAIQFSHVCFPWALKPWYFSLTFRLLFKFYTQVIMSVEFKVHWLLASGYLPYTANVDIQFAYLRRPNCLLIPHCCYPFRYLEIILLYLEYRVRYYNWKCHLVLNHFSVFYFVFVVFPIVIYICSFRSCFFLSNGCLF